LLKFSELPQITGGQLLQEKYAGMVKELVIDSRKAVVSDSSVFFAIKGERNDGHEYVGELYEQGIRQFIVQEGEELDLGKLPEANVLRVQDSVHALQQITAAHRNHFSFPVMAISGSNGKTIIKEWLAQLLAPEFQVVKSPKSYNSQVGVPLALWQINENHNFGIFEAGISMPGEMARLEAMIRPQFGLYTNIGSAHDEGFESEWDKINEKLQLFVHLEVLFYCKDHRNIHTAILAHPIISQKRLFSWSTKELADFQIIETRKHHGDVMLKAIFGGRELQFDFYFDDDASVENITHCICILLYLGFAPEDINKKIKQLRKVAMRLELKEGVNSCYLIDDSYNNDLAGLKIAVDFLVQQNQSNKKTIIFSDVLESGMNREILYKYIAGFLKSRGVVHIIGIGFEVSRYKEYFEGNTRFFPDTKSFLQKINPTYFQKEVILIKGARVFQFEKIVNKLLQKVHGTLLEINLDALVHNFNFYKSRLKPETKVMAMVKSFAYGSGTHEIASILQFHKAEYLAVAYTDEGVRLREAGITLPIMVMNPSPQTFDKILQFHLEPVAYSMKMLASLSDFTHSHLKRIPIHIEIDSGMRRLGFEPNDLGELIGILKSSNGLYPVSVFTHLAGSDEERLREFTNSQIKTYNEMADTIEQKLGHTFLRHAVNSAGILRYPEYQMDMVRLGIGLYGVEASGQEQHHLQQVSTLKTTISQVKTIKAGESVGYGRNQYLDKDSRIGVIAIGYGDGYDRGFSKGNGKVLVGDKLVPTVGNVCMDMTMIDLTETNAEEGDEVIVFGEKLPVHELAKSIGTIPYEILTNVSERVKRVFFTT